MPENYKEKSYDVGVLIGKFQVDELHPGHRQLVEAVIAKHKKVIILVGVSPTLGTKLNPLDYPTRRALFDEYADPNVIIQPVWDVPSNKVWSDNVDHLVRTIAPLGSVCLYGGRDSFIEHYEGIFNTYEYQVVTDQEGTTIRVDLGKEVVDSRDFRKGAIYSSQNRYPTTYPVVDIAVIKENRSVLLGMKKGGTGLAFPGGFVDPTDESLEKAARRELMEEIDVEVGMMDYVGSMIIDDWRYRKGSDVSVMTSFFKTPYVNGAASVIDEFEHVGWYDLHAYIPMSKTHKPLLDMLRKNLEIGVSK
ncbi:MAG: NUDIX domain-containing protein [Deltaproteobacteria bacterium]|nr:NUDIX domain-containing protein [Deltaproteobacteria bacterium]